MAKRIGTQGTAPFVIQDTGIPQPAGHSDYNVGGPFHVSTLADLKAIPSYYLIDKSVEGEERPVWGAMGYVHSDSTPENNGRWELKKGLVDNDITNPDNWQKMGVENLTADEVTETPTRVFLTPQEKAKITLMRGIFANEADIIANIPIGEEGWYVQNLDTVTFWFWNTSTSEWVDTNKPIADEYVHPNHTGDVTSEGDGATTITNKAVTNEKLADMAANRIKGTQTSGQPKDLTAEEVRGILNVENGATKNSNTDELDEGSENKYFTEARAVAAKVAGYVKAVTPTPLTEEDSILQALGKLEGLLDDKLTIEGESHICIIPGSDPEANGTKLIAAYNAAKSKTPGGNPLSETNRVTIILFPGYYQSAYPNNLTIDTEFIDVVGFGNKDSIVLMLHIEPSVNDFRLSNFTHQTPYSTNFGGGNSTKTILTDIKIIGPAWSANSDTGFNGWYENIENATGNVVLSYASTEISGTFRNIRTSGNYAISFSQASGSYYQCSLRAGIINASANIVDCNIYSLYQSVRISGATILNSTITVEMENPQYPIIRLGEGSVLGYCRIIHKNTNVNFIEAENGVPTNVSIHHCIQEDIENGDTPIIDPNINNLITNGHNSWDSEGGGGIEDIIEGTNTSIDKTNPKKPVINFTGDGLGAGMFAPVQNLTVLRAIDTTDTDIYKDKWLIHVEDAGLYRFDREGTGVDDGNQIITPTVGGGRWFKMSSSITSHEMLTGVQGGTTGQHYHLTAAEYLIVAATELAFTNAIKQEIEEKITLEDLPSSSLIREEISITGGLLDMTNIDIGDLTLEENTIISSVAGFEEGSKMINLFPNGYTLDWHSSVVNPVNVDGELSTTEESLILILCTSTDPLKIRVKNESNPTPELPKVDVVLNHGNINSTGEPWSNLVYLSTAGALTTGLHNYDMTPSPVEVKINEEFSINVANNKNAGLSGDVPNTMIKSCFTNAHTHFGRLIYILNLDDQKTYTISMILCNDTVGAKTDISINGGATQTYDTFELTTWVEIGSFSPTDGIISIGFAKNPESTQDAYLCVTRITEDD